MMPAAKRVFVVVPAFALLLSLCPVCDAKSPVKVFILAGQSNMQGHGRIDLGKDGDLEFAAKQDKFSYLKNNGQWAERDDVWFFHKNGKGDVIKGKLQPGQGASETSVGPELAFGHVIGNHFEQPVLIIKCAWGGQAIAMTFRPPSAGLPDYLETTYERAKKKRPELTIDEFKLTFGSKYRQTLEEVKTVLANLKQQFPEYQDEGYEVSGFFWHQGWNDGTNRQFAEEYESNMTHFIKDMRNDLGNKDLPFVIATSGMGGPEATGVAGFIGKSIEPAQMSAAKKFEHCIAVPTRHFQIHQPGRQKSHWYNSAESYCLVGDAAAKAMIEILSAQ